MLNVQVLDFNSFKTSLC